MGLKIADIRETQQMMKNKAVNLDCPECNSSNVQSLDLQKMIQSKTVLVLGAGASIPYGFPSGKKLKDEIYSKVLSRKNVVLNEMMGTDVIRLFIDRLKYSPEESIDAFLEHESDPRIIDFGKLAIAAILLPYEREESLFDNFINRDEGKENFNWYRYLWNQMNRSFDDFEKKISIITFNYDRSIEYYLYTALKHKYPGKEDRDYNDKLKDIPIIHIYGKLGFLPWECTKEQRPVPYNYDWNKPEEELEEPGEKEILIENAASNIQIIHENEKIENEEKIKIQLNNAKRIYFLGFGFNPINLERLLKATNLSGCEVKGTIYNMSRKSKRIANDILYKYKKKGIWDFQKHFFDTTICDFYIFK